MIDKKKSKTIDLYSGYTGNITSACLINHKSSTLATELGLVSLYSL